MWDEDLGQQPFVLQPLTCGENQRASVDPQGQGALVSAVVQGAGGEAQVTRPGADMNRPLDADDLELVELRRIEDAGRLLDDEDRVVGKSQTESGERRDADQREELS